MSHFETEYASNLVFFTFCSRNNKLKLFKRKKNLVFLEAKERTFHFVNWHKAV